MTRCQSKQIKNITLCRLLDRITVQGSCSHTGVSDGRGERAGVIQGSSRGHSIPTSFFGCAIVWGAFVIASWMRGGRHNKQNKTEQEGTASPSCHFLKSNRSLLPRKLSILELRLLYSQTHWIYIYTPTITDFTTRVIKPISDTMLMIQMYFKTRIDYPSYGKAFVSLI